MAPATSPYEMYARACAMVPVKVHLRAGIIRRRSSRATVLLMIATLGLYWPVWLFRLSRELRRAAGAGPMRPYLDLLLTLATGGLYGLVVMHRAARHIHAVSTYLDRSHVDASRKVLLYSLGGLVTFGLLGLVAVRKLQRQMNELAHLAERSAARREHDRARSRLKAAA